MSSRIERKQVDLTLETGTTSLLPCSVSSSQVVRPDRIQDMGKSALPLVGGSCIIPLSGVGSRLGGELEPFYSHFTIKHDHAQVSSSLQICLLTCKNG